MQNAERLRPWESEPARLEWIEESTGQHCLIQRSSLGALCGYVGGRLEWPWFGEDHREIEGITVHGGLTHAGMLHGTDHTIWWIGFDCAHWQDYCPNAPVSVPGTRYRDIEFVKREIASLARQLQAKGLAKARTRR